jgi:hypothetical protein
MVRYGPYGIDLPLFVFLFFFFGAGSSNEVTVLPHALRCFIFNLVIPWCAVVSIIVADVNPARGGREWGDKAVEYWWGRPKI